VARDPLAGHLPPDKPVVTARDLSNAALGIDEPPVYFPALALTVRGQSSGESLLYQRPSFSGDDRLFFDLLSYAPGLNARGADLLAVLEAEARHSPAGKPGAIDATARALFAKARPAGWRALTCPAAGDRPAFSVTFDGAGRYAYDRTLSSGLRERVVCDGATLWHLYPELGLASRRAVSRFHRLDLAGQVPFALPQPEDLVRGADLKLVGPRTVAVVLHGADAKGADGKPRPYAQLRFVFAEDGRLAERQVVELPARKTLLRETYSAEGAVKRVADGETRTVLDGKLAEGKAPALKPDLRKLVVLDLPVRSRDHVLKTRKLDKTRYEDLRFEDARALLAAAVAAGDQAQAQEVFRRALLGREQKEIGYYVLLASCGLNLDSDHLDVLGAHPDDPLAHYLALHSSPVLRKHASQWAARGAVWPEGFLQRLASAHALCQRWQQARALAGSAAQRRAERDRALAFVRRHRGSALAWALLGLVQDRTADYAATPKADARADYQALAEAWQRFEGLPGLGRAARYERARCLLKAGQAAAARKLFRALYDAALRDGELLRLDGDFREALRAEDGWGELLRQTAAALVEQKKRGAVLTLARQCWQLDDQPLAQHLYATALRQPPAGKEGTALRLAGLGFLWQTGQLAQADRLLQGLLAEPDNGKQAELWRLAARLAEQRDMPARQLECLEKALELEQARPPARLDLEQVRADHGQLLEHYQKLAEALVTLKLPAPAGFRDKVVRAADRWRGLDREATNACQAAARALQVLGQRELAWDYLTTPVALRPHEAEPWAQIAERLKRQGELALADRAWRAAFEAEPTNAGLLWERAQNLRQAGQLAQARALYRQLAEGDWQPRFAGLKAQARWALER
jgi:Tfp pilus assembly protein PilF